MGKRASSRGGPGDSWDRETNKNKLNKGTASTHPQECDADSERDFWLGILSMESCGEIAPIDRLLLDGCDLPPPERLNEMAISAKLRELVHLLASYRVFLERTDHLSDRELYAWLWGHALREGIDGFGMPGSNCHLDVLGGCSEQDLILAMRYYADDEERAQWAVDFPDFPMPPKEAPPYDRDRDLPKPGY